MLIVRGVNLFPSAIEDVLRQMPSVGGEFLIVIDDSLKDAAGFLTGIKLQVEPAAGAPPSLAEDVAKVIRDRLTVRAVVEIVPAGSLPRAVHKAKRIMRKDQERSEEHKSELQSLMRISYAVFCLKKKNNKQHKK